MCIHRKLDHINFLFKAFTIKDACKHNNVLQIEEILSFSHMHIHIGFVAGTMCSEMRVRSQCHGHRKQILTNQI